MCIGLQQNRKFPKWKKKCAQIKWMQTKSYKFNKFTKRLPNRQRNEILVILVGKNDDECQNKKS